MSNFAMDKYKNTTYAVLLILIFAVGIVMAFAPTASAQTGIAQPRQSYGYISASPLLLGVGQTLTINLWVAPTPTGPSLAPWYGYAPLNEPVGYTGISVTFTRPDGTTDTFMPTQTTGNYKAGETDALGSMVFFYSPNMAGNWSVTFSMPAQNFTDPSGTVLIAPCTSSPAYFTVQTAAVNAGLLNGWPWQPLPNSNVYWTYPINSNNREWSTIAGMWPLTSGGYWQPYGSGPSTDHIVWGVNAGNGGIIGGQTGDLSLQGAGTTPIILLGKVYIPSTSTTFTVNGYASGYNCYSLTTGQFLYSSNDSITRGIIIPGNPYSQSVEETQESDVVLAGSAAPTAYLFGTTTGPTNKAGLATTNWNYFNPLNGQLVRQLTNATMGTGIMTDDSNYVYGNVLSGQITTPPYWCANNYVWGWNYSKVTTTTLHSGLVTGDWYTGLMWKTNESNHNAGQTPQYGPGDGSDRTATALSADMSTLVVGGGPGDTMAMGFNTATGASVWNDTFNYVCLGAFPYLYYTNYFVTFDRDNGGTWRCYSDLTGALMWTDNAIGILPWCDQEDGISNDANNIYIPSPDGTLNAVSIATGKILWQSTPIPSTESVENALPMWQGFSQTCIVVGGYCYMYLGYSTIYEQEPIPRFSVAACYNATTGATVWILDGGNSPTATSDGYLMTIGILSGMEWCIGKGQTSTSISTGNTVITKGDTVQIQGSVLDQSPAQPGTPAVSDSCMSEQMDYLHMQNATLLNSGYTPQGVAVTLTALDPNNNTENIGTTTSNGDGNYAIDWTPPVPGIYQITATFAGTNSYFPSSSETALTVTAAAATTTTQVTTTTSGVSTTTLYSAIAAVIVVMIVIAIVLAVLMLRKRP